MKNNINIGVLLGTFSLILGISSVTLGVISLFRKPDINDTAFEYDIDELSPAE
ncbi:MAG: hypothetical protein PHO67_08095 [Candidatus Omnitrophica bacterium]|nr:hypothetical protein [Candidatus Omnitrophota bacterium]